MTRRTVFAIALLASIGCDNRQEAEPPVVARPAASTPKVLVEKSYKISSDMDESPVRRVVEIKLKQKISPDDLRKIALEVKAREERPHERTVIYYYLPVVFPELAGDPWASTHFTPELNVKILGLSKQEEETMRSIPLDHKGKRIGAWLQDNQYKTLDLIYEENGTIKIAEIRLPNERSDSDMIEVPLSNGRRFKKVKGTNNYDVDVEGNLRISNTGGQLISAAKPMR